MGDESICAQLKSANQLVVYDKTHQLKKEKGILIDEDVCRIELRMSMPQMLNFIMTINELAGYDWSFIYPKYFSLHSIHNDLIAELAVIKKDWNKPIWELRNIMEEEYDIWPSNFYKEYLMDHPILTYAIVNALSNYKWKND